MGANEARFGKVVRFSMGSYAGQTDQFSSRHDSIPFSLFSISCCKLPVLTWSVQRVEAQTFTVTATQGQADIGKDRSSYQSATLNSSYTIPSWGKTDDGAYITISFCAGE